MTAPHTPREAARQREIDRMARTCAQMIAAGITQTARLEKLYRKRTSPTTKEHAC